MQRSLQRVFGRERVLFGRPLDAVARGAAAFVAGADFYDYIQHDYAIRWRNPDTGNHGLSVRFIREGQVALDAREDGRAFVLEDGGGDPDHAGVAK
ncbi:MAG TPA: hypothetical protein VNA57_04895 [Acidimicrobiales bacterium]|nr:hypothetical protein [Acidimicrobiales bacterium]